MRKTILVSLLTIMLHAAVPHAEAQQPAKIAEDRLARGSSCDPAFMIDSFQHEFRKLGYVDGKNVTFEYRFAEGKLDRLPVLADELVRLKVDVLIAPNTPAALAFKNTTTTIPIVFIDVTDPIAVLVDSLARPGETSRDLQLSGGVVRQTT